MVPERTQEPPLGAAGVSICADPWPATRIHTEAARFRCRWGPPALADATRADKQGRAPGGVTDKGGGGPGLACHALCLNSAGDSCSSLPQRQVSRGASGRAQGSFWSQRPPLRTSTRHPTCYPEQDQRVLTESCSQNLEGSCGHRGLLPSGLC